MKKHYYLLIFSFFAFAWSQAQVVEIISTDRIVEKSTDEYIVKSEFDVINISDQAISLDWSRDISGLVDGWISWVCDANACYPDFVDESPEPNIMEPGDTARWFIDVRPEEIAGVGTAILYIFPTGGSAPIDTFEAEFRIGSLSADDLTVLESKSYLFPNPSQIFYLSASEDVSRIVVTDIMGRTIQDVNIIGSNALNMSAARPGTYFASLLDADGRKIRNQRIIVR